MTRFPSPVAVRTHLWWVGLGCVATLLELENRVTSLILMHDALKDSASEPAQVSPPLTALFGGTGLPLPQGVLGRTVTVSDGP